MERKRKVPTRTRKAASSSAPTASSGGRYHHGDLRTALIQATLSIVERDGIDAVSVREAARRAGVSSRAPFRHFPDKTALMTAVAEEAIRLYQIEMSKALAATDDNPLLRFRALGMTTVRFALEHPTLYRVATALSDLDVERSELLKQSRDESEKLTQHLLADAQRRGIVHARDPRIIQLAAQALTHGLASMLVHGQLRIASVDEAMRLASAVMDVFGQGLVAQAAENPKPASKPRRRGARG